MMIGKSVNEAQAIKNTDIAQVSINLNIFKINN